MKLKTVSQPPSVAYPTYREYHVQRDAVLRRLALGTGALLAAGVAASCRPPPRTAGTPPVPTRVIEQPEARILGDVAVPAAPAVTSVAGESTLPVLPPVNPPGGTQAPALEPEGPPPAVLGKIAAPQPVPPPPRLMGAPPALPPPPAPGK